MGVLQRLAVFTTIVHLPKLLSDPRKQRIVIALADGENCRKWMSPITSCKIAAQQAADYNRTIYIRNSVANSFFILSS